MARVVDPTSEEEREFRAFLKHLPDHIRKAAQRFDPWTLYRLKNTNDRVTISKFYEGESGTLELIVSVTGEYNFTPFERDVFGVLPDDLEECDPPADHERVGVLMEGDPLNDDRIHEIRATYFPHDWEMGPDGIARRKVH